MSDCKSGIYKDTIVTSNREAMEVFFFVECYLEKYKIFSKSKAFVEINGATI